MRLLPYKLGLLSLLLLALSSVLLSAIGQSSLPYSHQSHLPILINGNNQFTTSNGVSYGNGTATNPYIIQGWDIFVRQNSGIDSDRWNGIRIENTTAHFLINDTWVRIEDVLTNGMYPQTCGGVLIFLNNVTNGHVEDSSLPQLPEGRVPCTTGMAISNSSDITVEGNAFYPFDPVGLRVYNSKRVTIIGNVFMSPLKLTSSSDILVHHNDFYSGAVTMLDDSPGQNAWDDGYPGGGNYWSLDIYGMIDNCHGPKQDLCTGPDGVSDIPLYIGQSRSCGQFESCVYPIDHYPLVKPHYSAPDTFPPRWSAGILEAELHTGGITPWSVTLSWPDTAETSNITGYRIYNGGGCTTTALVSLPSNTSSYTITGLSPGTIYSFHVEAGNTSGQWSCNGPGVSFQTPSIWGAYWHAIVLGVLGVLGAFALEERRRNRRRRKDLPNTVLLHESPTGQGGVAAINQSHSSVAQKNRP